MKLIFLEKVDSTNEYLKRVDFCHGLCVVAKKQTGGKGRRGKKWISEEEKGLYVSFMFSPINPKIASLSSLAFGVAVINTLKGLDDRFYLKWPNDIYINGKKVSGILPELLSDRLIAGIGINLSYSEEELLSLDVPATSLLVEGISFDRQKLLEKLIFEVNRYYNKLSKGMFDVKEFEKSCPLIGKRVTVIEGNRRYTGRALGIDMDGCLVVESEMDGKIKRLFSADVSVRF